MPLPCPALSTCEGLLDCQSGSQRWCGRKEFGHLASGERLGPDRERRGSQSCTIFGHILIV